MVNTAMRLPESTLLLAYLDSGHHSKKKNSVMVGHLSRYISALEGIRKPYSNTNFRMTIGKTLGLSPKG